MHGVSRRVSSFLVCAVLSVVNNDCKAQFPEIYQQSLPFFPNWGLASAARELCSHREDFVSFVHHSHRSPEFRSTLGRGCKWHQVIWQILFTSQPPFLQVHQLQAAQAHSLRMQVSLHPPRDLGMTSALMCVAHRWTPRMARSLIAMAVIWQLWVARKWHVCRLWLSWHRVQSCCRESCSSDSPLLDDALPACLSCRFFTCGAAGSHHFPHQSSRAVEGLPWHSICCIKGLAPEIARWGTAVSAVPWSTRTSTWCPAAAGSRPTGKAPSVCKALCRPRVGLWGRAVGTQADSTLCLSGHVPAKYSLCI